MGNMLNRREKRVNTKSKMCRLYIRLMIACGRAGCHQRPDRSFFYKGYQFPMCARCTGVLLGYILAVPCWLLWGGNFGLCVLLAGVMFLDWLVQYMEILESRNWRRLLTGIMGGYSVATTYIIAIKGLIKLF